MTKSRIFEVVVRQDGHRVRIVGVKRLAALLGVGQRDIPRIRLFKATFDKHVVTEIVKDEPGIQSSDTVR